MTSPALTPRGPLERLLGPLSLGCCLLALAWAPPAGFWPRLVGPLGSLAAAAQWVRADLAFEAGELAVALARAERAIALDPRNPDGWASLVIWQGGTLASATREGQAAHRVAWVEAALATAERARALARPYGPVASAAAAVLYAQADSEPPLDWPGGATALGALADAYGAQALADTHGQR